MAVTISNKNVLNNFRTQISGLGRSDIYNKIADQVATDLKLDIIAYIQERESNIDWTDLTDVNFSTETITTVPAVNGMARINFGNKDDLIKTADGTEVNQYFFIEFGFGLMGEANKTYNSGYFGWQYNINNWTDLHSKSWKIAGSQGISFSLRARDNFMTIVKSAMNKVLKEEGILK